MFKPDSEATNFHESRDNRSGYQQEHGQSQWSNLPQSPYAPPNQNPWGPNPNQNQGPSQNRVRPNFSRTELRNAIIPKQIAKEIRGEKWRLLGILTLGFALIAAALFFLLFHYLVPLRAEGLRWKIPDQYIPQPAPMIIMGVFGLLFLIWGLIGAITLRIDIRSYRGDILMGYERIPHFIKRNYRALLCRPIYLNWIAFNVYIWGAIAIGIFYLIRTVSKGDLSMKTEIIIMLSILVLTLVIHVCSLFSIRLRRGRLSAYYGYDLEPMDIELSLKKRANRRCLAIFFCVLAVVLFAIIIPWMIVRKKDGKKIIPLI